jgi:hypothetical protein
MTPCGEQHSIIAFFLRINDFKFLRLCANVLDINGFKLQLYFDNNFEKYMFLSEIFNHRK